MWLSITVEVLEVEGSRTGEPVNRRFMRQEFEVAFYDVDELATERFKLFAVAA